MGPNVQYVRTGDHGFLHNVSRPIGPNGAQVDMQVLFVLGSIGETFEINGLSHFPMDIEYSVEKCHRNIVPGGSAVFQAGGLIVVLVAVGRKAYLASIVPVIVNAILNEHQIVVDIVAFVNKGDFPRSRLGEKQRGKILASWVQRKMRTMAQFGIRDADSGLSDVTETIEPRSGVGSVRNGSVIASSLRLWSQLLRSLNNANMNANKRKLRIALPHYQLAFPRCQRRTITTPSLAHRQEERTEPLPRAMIPQQRHATTTISNSQPITTHPRRPVS